MSFEFTFAPVEVSPLMILDKAALFLGQPFGLDGHFYDVGDDGVMQARLDCLRLLFFTWRECGLWPESWDGVLPRQLRAIRLETGNAIRTLEDFPVLGSLLETNFAPVALDVREPGDVLCFEWKPQKALHHAGFETASSPIYGGICHVPARGVVCCCDLDENWLLKLKAAWRLKPVALRGNL